MEDKRNKSYNKGGRPPEKDPAIYRYSFKLNSKERLKFESMYEESGVHNKAKFITSVIFGKPIKVVKIDNATTDYYIRLTNFYRQFQAIGNNYNQTVVAIRSNFGEKRGLQMLAQLEKATIQLVILSKKIAEMTQEYEEKYLKAADETILL